MPPPTTSLNRTSGGGLSLPAPRPARNTVPGRLRVATGPPVEERHGFPHGPLTHPPPPPVPIPFLALDRSSMISLRVSARFMYPSTRFMMVTFAACDHQGPRQRAWEEGKADAGAS